MNFYLPTYQKIEEEVLDLSYKIFIDDKQLKTYSLAISDIIVRCSVEIESISKEIYARLGGNMEPVDSDGKNRTLYFDTDCLRLINDKWHLDKKTIRIISPDFHLSKEKTTLVPLKRSHFRGDRGSKWKSAYQSVKHDRSHFYENATVENMLNALGALYILNLYYLDQPYWLDNPIKNMKEYNTHSKIFEPEIADATKLGASTKMGDKSISGLKNLDSCIYISKLTKNAFISLHREICKIEIELVSIIQSLEKYVKYKEMHQEDNRKILDIADSIGIDSYVIRAQLIKRREPFKYSRFVEVCLNKCEQIYPDLTSDEFIRSEEGIKFLRDIDYSIKNYL